MKFVDARKEFGLKLRAYREEAGFTQRQMMKKLKLQGPQFISNFERGMSLPPLPMLGKMCTLYRMNHAKVLDQFVKTMRYHFQERMGGKW